MKSLYVICSTGIILMLAALFTVLFFGCSHHKTQKAKKNPPVTNVYPSIEVSKSSEDSKDNDPLEIKEPIFIDREKDPYNFPKPKPNPRPNKK